MRRLARAIISKFQAKQSNKKSANHFSNLEIQLLDSIRNFRKSESLSDIEQARKILGQNLDSVNQNVITGPIHWELIISGWINPAFNARIQKFVHLNSLDEQRIHISRHPRHDFPGSRRRKKSAGFVLSINSDSLTPFVDLSKFVCCTDGLPIPFASNSVKNISQEQPFFHYSFEQSGETNCNCGVWGYIENIYARPAGYLFDSKLWGSALARKYPEVALQVVSETGDSLLGQQLSFEFDRLAFPAEIAQKTKLLVDSPEAEHGPLELFGIDRKDLSSSTTSFFSSVFEDIPPLEHAVPGHENIIAPISDHLIINEAEIRAPGLVLSENNSVIFEAASDPTLPFVSGLWGNFFGSPIAPTKVLIERSYQVPLEIEEGIMLSGRNDQNWYHWIIEYLPRALFFDSLPDGIPFIVSDRVPIQGINALKMLSNRNVLTIPSGTPVIVHKLHLMRPVAQVLDTTRVSWPEGLRLDVETLSALRSKIIGNAKPTGGKYFLLRGSSHRGLLNESKCVEIAESFGYLAVNPAEMSFDEQLDIFSNASALIGAGGAVMANYLFAANNAQIVSLTSVAGRGFTLPAELSRIAGADFYYLLGPSIQNQDTFDSKLHWMHADFKININDLKKALSIVENKMLNQ